jgi:hypothetical protein
MQKCLASLFRVVQVQYPGSCSLWHVESVGVSPQRAANIPYFVLEFLEDKPKLVLHAVMFI